jgi:SOS-response transcriptional repressor LexA
VPTSRAAVSGLVPVYPADFTEATAATETARVADAIQKLIEPSSIVSVQNVAQKVQADGEYAATYGILRTVALSPTADPIALATSIVGKLRAAGWVQRQTSNTNGTYSTALSSVATGSKGWFIIVVGDSSVAGQPVVSLQLASPDLP